MRRPPRSVQSVQAFCCFLLLYLGSYALLSHNGDYMPAIAGESRWARSPVAIDRFVWQPRYCRWYQWQRRNGQPVTDSNLLGCVYLPLIAFDRARVHPTHRLH